MNKQIITSQLSEFGLDTIEIQIYLDLLEKGERTPLDLSRETNINRTKIYRYLERLKQKQLVEEIEKGRGLRLRASDPDNLQLQIMWKEQELASQKKLLPQIVEDLHSIPKEFQSTFEIKHYHGEEGLKQMTWNRLSAKKEILLYGYKTMNEIVGKNFAEKVREEQVRKKIMLYELEEDIDVGNFTGEFTYTAVAHWQDFYTPRYVDPKSLTIRQYSFIYNNTVGIMHWEQGIQVGIEIINEPYAAMQKQLFWQIWNKVGEKPKKSSEPAKK